MAEVAWRRRPPVVLAIYFQWVRSVRERNPLCTFRGRVDERSLNDLPSAASGRPAVSGAVRHDVLAGAGVSCQGRSHGRPAGRNRGSFFALIAFSFPGPQVPGAVRPCRRWNFRTRASSVRKWRSGCSHSGPPRRPVPARAPGTRAEVPSRRAGFPHQHRVPLRGSSSGLGRYRVLQRSQR